MQNLKCSQKITISELHIIKISLKNFPHNKFPLHKKISANSSTHRPAIFCAIWAFSNRKLAHIIGRSFWKAITVEMWDCVDSIFGLIIEGWIFEVWFGWLFAVFFLAVCGLWIVLQVGGFYCAKIWKFGWIFMIKDFGIWLNFFWYKTKFYRFLQFFMYSFKV